MSKDNDLTNLGRSSHDWAKIHMKALSLAEIHVRNEIRNTGYNPFEGIRIASCLHISKETSVFIDILKNLGAQIMVVAANPLSTQEDIASYLASRGINVRARRGESETRYREDIMKAVESRPNLIIDDGAELHTEYARSELVSCFGGTDETTSGTTRLTALERKDLLRYPLIAVNEANTKHVFDNKFGTGQSALDGLMRATGLLLAGKVMVISGYGWVGRGVALRARGLGARVIVTEIDPIKALDAYLDGYEVMKMLDASRIGDMFLTCTGQKNVITRKHFLVMKEAAIIGNVGHFNREIDVCALFAIGHEVRQVRAGVARITLPKSGIRKHLYLLNQGRVVNLASAEGHPPEIMQFSFSNQLLSLHYLAKNKKELGRQGKPFLRPVPMEIDDLVASFALKSFGLRIDSLSSVQRKYHESFAIH